MTPNYQNLVQVFTIVPNLQNLVKELLVIFRIYNLPWQSCERVVVCWLQLGEWLCLLKVPGVNLYPIQSFYQWKQRHLLIMFHFRLLLSYFINTKLIFFWFRSLILYFNCLGKSLQLWWHCCFIHKKCACVYAVGKMQPRINVYNISSGNATCLSVQNYFLW